MACCSTTSTNETYELQLLRTSTRSSQFSWPSLIPPIEQPTEFSPLTFLPWEIQLLIISYLDVRAALQLRRTCRLYFHHLTVDVVERLFTENRYITFDLLNCCIDCLTMSHDGYLVQDEFFRPGTWRSMCFRCWRLKRSPDYFDRPNHHITFVNGREGYACTLCGWPIRHDKRHLSCIRTSALMNCMWWIISAGHFLYVLVITTMVWLDYANVTLVIIPAVLNFLLSFVSLALLTLDFVQHSNTTRIRLPLELVSTVIWTPPVFYTSREVFQGKTRWDSYPVYLWTLFVAKLLGHTLNLTGLLLTSAEYDPRSPFLPDLSVKQKVFLVTCSFLVHWARVKYR
ncbi:uncharacterized protein F4807DRAFT_205429 [Annulohypoxylon truncatum]|uniref:uncharacterized protein n=1 Tax=Annulohypoxylon truncatum TaxID=327061 RepID=UPI002007F72B|nr:uncharacterized protein F4807DRAFT_205429 [Annulohypoxylon truncatum]KAI1213914.1 hypothetical protein F4807DRAFT_205429 [Annulohypoxylon truncatum]